MKINLKQLQDDLKSEKLSPIYYVYGQEAFLLDQVKNSFNRLPTDIYEVVNLDGEGIDLLQLNQELSMNSFFGQRKIVIVNHFEVLLADKDQTNLQALIDYIDHPAVDNSLVLMINSEKPDQRKKIIKLLSTEQVTTLEFNHTDQKQITAYLKQQFSKYQIEIDDRLVEYIIQRVDFNLTSLSQNLPKLISFAESETLNAESIDDLLTVSVSASSFDLVKSIFDKDKKHALQIVNQLFDQFQPPLSIIGALLSQYRLLLQVNGLKNQTTSLLKIHPYRVKLAQQELQKVSIDKINRGYQKIVESEIKLKTTSSNPQTVVEQLVVSLI